MGVWSSISFCNFEKRSLRNAYSCDSRNSNMKQILNIDSESFSTTVLQDVQEIRIQESDQFENSAQPLSNYREKESFDCPTYFEYSMGGNLKFYKEHLQQDFELENKVFSVKNLRQRLRKSSHSDNDSEPEALRYAYKPQEKVIPVVNTIAEEPELSFDDYSSIYQPEFMLNINSKSLVKEMPKHALSDRVNNKEIGGKRRNDQHKIASWSQDMIEDSPPDNVVEKLEVHIVNKSKKLPIVEQNDVLTNHEDMFDYHSSSVKTERNSEQLENQETKSIKDKSKVNQEMKSVKDKSKVNQEMKSVKDRSKGNQEMMSAQLHKNKLGTKNETVSLKPRQPKTSSDETKLTEAKNILSKENSSRQKKNIINHITPSPSRKVEIKNKSKDRATKPTEKIEKSKRLIQTKVLDNQKYTSISLMDKNTLPNAENNQTKAESKDNFLSTLSMDTTTMFDNIDLFKELGTAERKLSEPKLKEDVEFYPESPISEIHFFKTPCSTRHNSLETFEQLENECIEDSVKQEQEKPEVSEDNTLTSNLLPNYKKLPKEFQEMARRLSKKDSPKKSSPSLHQINSFQNFNCSSSTCSTISPRSPNGRTLFRTPSYKMPKTPSLSRQHPSTYVTQHTSSRSRSSSRVSSRAASPTREHIEALL